MPPILILAHAHGIMLLSMAKISETLYRNDVSAFQKDFGAQTLKSEMLPNKPFIQIQH